MEQGYFSQQYDTRCAVVEFTGDLAEIHFKPRVNVELADLVELKQLLTRKRQFQKYFLLLSFDQNFSVQWKSCSYYSDQLFSENYQNQSLVIKSGVKRLLAKCLFSVVRPKGKLRIFKHQSEAKKWLMGMRVSRNLSAEKYYGTLPQSA